MFKIFSNGLKLMMASSLMLSSNFLLQNNKVLAGDFLESCIDTRLLIGPQTQSLQASCETEDGYSFRVSVISPNRGLSNINGKLTWQTDGNFAASCSNVDYTIIPRYEVPLLTATCKKENGTQRNTAIDLNDKISNIDGFLTFDNF